MKYLIFDFDGVIGDTKEASAHATALLDNVDFVTALGLNQAYAHNKPKHVRDHSMSDTEMAAILEWTSKFGDIMMKSDFQLFNKFVNEIETIDTAYKGIVSSGSQKYVIPALAKTNIHPTHILAFEDHHSKEEKIEIICRDWGIKVTEVFYFTDTLADIYELRDMLSADKLIAVSWGYCKPEVLAQELNEQYILKTPKDIHKVLAYA